MVLTKNEIKARILEKKAIPFDFEKVRVENAEAITFRDLYELYLAIPHPRKWHWTDTSGRVSERLATGVSLFNVLRDVLLWPYVYYSLDKKISELENRVGSFSVKNGRNVSPLLFLRSDHWFNLKSGGSVGHISGVINGLRALGVKVVVASTDWLEFVDESKDFHLCGPVYGAGRNIPELPFFSYTDQMNAFVRERWESWRPKIIYQRYSLGNFTGVMIKNRYHVPYVCEYNGSLPWMAKHWANKRFLHEKFVTRIELLNLRSADLVVVVSHSSKEEIVDRGIPEDKILVNPNGVDTELYTPEAKGDKIVERYGLRGKTVVGFIGTFGKWHGAEVLAEAFGLLINRYPEHKDDIRLLMIGDGATMPQVREKLGKYGVAGDVVLTGSIPQAQAPDHLAACDILVSPHIPNPDGTPFFGSPTKLFEYMAMGKAIVASDLDQIGEILEHEKTAWMVEPGNTEALMNGLKTLADNAALRTKLGTAARNEAAAKYTWKAHTQRIIDALKERF